MKFISNSETAMMHKMKVAYYMPFKPMGHRNPSGDLIMGTELLSYFESKQHNIELVSKLRCRWLYFKPWKWWRIVKDYCRIHHLFKKNSPDIWLTYHSYYKAPDLLGPLLCKKFNLPYVIFQGIYSTKRRKHFKTWLGFQLNKHALCAANLVFTNKKNDERNLLRLLPPERVQYIAPGIHPDNFEFDLVSRRSLQNRWQTGDRKIVFTAAMFRPGVKTKGVQEVIDSCAALISSGINLQLVIAGDGTNRLLLEEYAQKKVGDAAIFLGKIPRHELYRYYSAADVFAFPGINESLGMVFLEAQSCGLPVVAYNNWGANEAVVHEATGFLPPYSQKEKFTEAISLLLTNSKIRKAMRDAAKAHVRSNHDIEKNYALIEDSMQKQLSKKTTAPFKK